MPTRKRRCSFPALSGNDFAPAPGGAATSSPPAADGKADGSAGVLLVLLDEQLLEELYAPALGEGGEIYIYDQDGFIVSHSNKKNAGQAVCECG